MSFIVGSIIIGSSVMAGSSLAGGLIGRGKKKRAITSAEAEHSKRMSNMSN